MINRRYADMQTNVGNNIQDTSSATQTIIGRVLNDAYFDLMRRVNFRAINEDFTFASVAGTEDYVLRSDFGKEIRVVDPTNKFCLTKVDLYRLFQEVDSLNASGTPSRYTIIDSAAQANPSSASALSIVSSSNSDTTQTLFIRGYTGTVEVNESVTLTGTTPAASTNSYTEIKQFTKSATAAGTVTITSNSGAITNAVIAPEVLDYKVKKIRLQPIPTGVVTYEMPYIINPFPMFDNNDTPVIEAADVIEAMATSIMWKYQRQYSKAQEWERISEKMIQNLIWDMHNEPNQINLFNVHPYSRETV